MLLLAVRSPKEQSSDAGTAAKFGCSAWIGVCSSGLSMNGGDCHAICHASGHACRS